MKVSVPILAGTGREFASISVPPGVSYVHAPLPGSWYVPKPLPKK